MKKRIFSIMDTGKKRTGVAVICAAMLLTLGTGFAISASASEVTSPTPNPAYINGIGVANATTGETYYVGTDGNLVPSADFDGDFFTYDEYKAYIEEKKIEFQEILIGKMGYTQEEVDALIEIYEKELEGIANGTIAVPKTDGAIGMKSPDSANK